MYWSATQQKATVCILIGCLTKLKAIINIMLIFIIYIANMAGYDILLKKESAV